MPSSFDNQLGNSCMLRQHWLHERRVHFLNQNEGIKMMELIQTVALRAPLVIACAVFAMAAMFKLGKEKGAGLIAVGAAGLCLTVIINPFFSYLVMPRIVRDMDPQNISFDFSDPKLRRAAYESCAVKGEVMAGASPEYKNAAHEHLSMLLSKLD